MTGLLLLAAGSGERLGADVPKALVEIAGDSMIGHCLGTAAGLHWLNEIVLVAPASEVAGLAQEVGSRFPGVTVVAGGASRDASVRAGLAAISPQTEHVLIHDAARPFAPVEVYDRVRETLTLGARAVVPALPVTDTIKLVDHGVVEQTLPRERLVAVQTPQGFHVGTLLRAHAARSGAVTDDAMLVERSGVPVVVVAGSQYAVKITTPFDLRIAESLARPDGTMPT
jgi:2-C-methyl-D-erythritol 4-phosphate cytidylyltransferase